MAVRLPRDTGRLFLVVSIFVGWYICRQGLQTGQAGIPEAGVLFSLVSFAQLVPTKRHLLLWLPLSFAFAVPYPVSLNWLTMRTLVFSCLLILGYYFWADRYKSEPGREAR